MERNKCPYCNGELKTEDGINSNSEKVEILSCEACKRTWTNYNRFEEDWLIRELETTRFKEAIEELSGEDGVIHAKDLLERLE